MGKYVHAAGQGDVQTRHILGMRKNGEAVPMRFFDRRSGNGGRQDRHLPLRLRGAGKQLDSVDAFGGVITHQGRRLLRR